MAEGEELDNRDSSVREQDRFLPIANISRIMKKALPNNAKIAKDAKETVQECVSEYISFITSECAPRRTPLPCSTASDTQRASAGACASLTEVPPEEESRRMTAARQSPSGRPRVPRSAWASRGVYRNAAFAGGSTIITHMHRAPLCH